jgi:DNA-binding MarR family transcriptional regulator
MALADSAARISGCTCFKLRNVTRRLTRLYDVHLAAAGLRLTQYSLLAVLVRGGATTMSRLADAMGMDRTTLTRNLKPLAEAGWVEVSAGADARERIVSATDAGRETWQAARGHWRRAQDEVNRTLGAEEVAALHALLDGAAAKLHPVREEET